MCHIFTVIIARAYLVSFMVVLTYQHNSCLQREREREGERWREMGGVERTGFEHEVATDRREVAYIKLISYTKGLEYENFV